MTPLIPENPAVPPPAVEQETVREKVAEALETIIEWKDFPETGLIHDDGKTPKSYGWCYGSNGERDYMRGIAQDALTLLRKSLKEKEAQRATTRKGQAILGEIQWEPIASGTCTPGWSGYKADLYLTGYPERGWCLYSRDGTGYWNQCTKQLIAPEVGAEPYRENDKWWWVRKNADKDSNGKSNS